mmetsp:Transcript_48697/g.122902  ORF Transcript_48697/g.122902 Transcript_48697/m.122902 type:complete len:248 (-) Transcript_48697:419-1162(-)
MDSVLGYPDVHLLKLRYEHVVVVYDLFEVRSFNQRRVVPFLDERAEIVGDEIAELLHFVEPLLLAVLLRLDELRAQQGRDHAHERVRRENNVGREEDEDGERRQNLAEGDDDVAPLVQRHDVEQRPHRGSDVTKPLLDQGLLADARPVLGVLAHHLCQEDGEDVVHHGHEYAQRADHLEGLADSPREHDQSSEEAEEPEDAQHPEEPQDPHEAQKPKRREVREPPGAALAECYEREDPQVQDPYRQQ